MPTKSTPAVAFRIAICLYAVALFGWLALGLLPVLAEHLQFVRDALSAAAAHHSADGRFAGRVLHPDTMADVTSATQTAVQYSFSLVNLALGLLLLARRPDDVVPRLLGFALLGTAATFNLPSHRAFHITGNPWPIALAHFTFHIVSGVTYVWAVLLFPDGRLPRQVRIGTRATAVYALVFTALVALLCWRSSFLSHPQFFVIFFGIAVPAFGVSAQVLRLRDRGTTVLQRRTARMLCAALLPAFVAALLWTFARGVSALGSGTLAHQAEALATQTSTWFPVVFAMVPIVLFAAVLRYRLWDLDRWLSRVLVYGVIALLIGAGYVVAVAVSGALAGSGALWTLIIALSVAAAAAEPLRTRARRWANRVVFGVSLSPQDALRSLGEGLAQLTPRGELDHLVDVTVRATRASSATLWLVDGPQVVAAASVPARDVAAHLETTEVSFDAIAEALADWCCFPITHQGELLGVLAVRGADGRAMPNRDRSVIVEIADHAGLLVHNAMLTVGLARQAEQRAAMSVRLREARRRLVAAQDAERRRLERDLHDGAQQALVATLLGLRAIAAQRDDGGDRIASLRGVVEIARESLVELVNAEYPAGINELGLRGALERAAELTDRLGITVVQVAEGDLDDIDPRAASAVYFSCVEALQNVAKYAGAHSVRIELSAGSDEVRFAVTDDGVGFDATNLSQVGGLTQLESRLVEVGGSFTVHTRPGAGTRIAGHVPTRVATVMA